MNIKEARQFLTMHELSLISSDKTNRIVVCPSASHSEEVIKTLQDENNYTNIGSSRCLSIENQANKIIKEASQLMTFAQHDIDKLFSQGSEPARLRCVIKDHKKLQNGSFPLRPIASVHNTPTDKIDWVISIILGQLLQFIPSYISSAVHLINQLDSKIQHSVGSHFISLDVISLYPSIPLKFGLDCIDSFLDKYFDKIDSYGLTKIILMKMINFVCYNYEITFDSITVKQKTGVPMGARFAPPFAIICMHYIEELALNLLEQTVKPIIYFRYIDDIILGPVPFDNDLHTIILNTFNGINKHIQFTIEAPNPSQWLTFLDTKLTFNSGQLLYSWYSKELDSNNSLHANSHHSNRIKENFLCNEFFRIRLRCCNESIRKECFKTAYNKFRYLNYTHKDINRAMGKAIKKPVRNSTKIGFDKNLPVLKLPFINDKTCRSVRKCIRSSNIPFNVVFKPSRNVMNTLNTRNTLINKCDNCTICHSLKKPFTCKSKNIVYCYTCSICNEQYIGYTARQVKKRHSEHKRSIEAADTKSALSVHLVQKHTNTAHDISIFTLSILTSCNDPTNTCLAESILINELKPAINRKFELAALM